MSDDPQFQEPIYLGDGVYAGHDGWQIWLRLNSHENRAGQIALEPEVWKRLKSYVDGLDKRRASYPDSLIHDN